jgi:hypothetical protein
MGATGGLTLPLWDIINSYLKFQDSYVLQLISHSFSLNVANFVQKFMHLIGLFLFRDQSHALFTNRLVNFSMNFWTSQRSSERSTQSLGKSYMKSTVTSSTKAKLTLIDWDQGKQSILWTGECHCRDIADSHKSNNRHKQHFWNLQRSGMAPFWDLVVSAYKLRFHPGLSQKF